MEMTLAEIAGMLDGELCGDGTQMIRGAAPFENAAADEITFASGIRFLKHIAKTQAAAVIIPRKAEATGKNLVRVDNPQLAFIRVLERFLPAQSQPTGVSPAASIAETAMLGEDVFVGPYAVVGPHTRLGNRVRIAAGTVIGAHVQIGDDVEVHPNVTILDRTRIGNRVRIQAGTVIGSDGFGYVPDGEHWHRIPHLGIVQIDDDVEIGAGNTIDRATFGRTWLQHGVRTDNLVHIAHNVTIGPHSVLAGQVGVAGSVTIGRHAILAGQVGVSQHLELGDHVTVGPQAGIAQSVADGQTVSGTPEMPHRLWLKVQRIIPRLPELKRRIGMLEKRLQRLEQTER